MDNGLVLVTDDVRDGGGTYLREEDLFHPQQAGDESRSVVGGLLPPGAVSADAVDDTGRRVAAAVANGAYAALLEQPIDGVEPIVCCRDPQGRPVRRPRADAYPSERVIDAEEPCPACGAVDWDEYTPFEQWRGGTPGPGGTTIPNPVVSCRVCGDEESQGTFFAIRSDTDESEDEATRSTRAARIRAHARKQQWFSNTMTLRATAFPIYAADGWYARLGGSGSHGDDLTEITIYHYDTPDADPFAGDPPRLEVTTKREPHANTLLLEARHTLENWIVRGAEGGDWPDASRAAIALWLRARDRERRAAALGAVRSKEPMIIDGSSTPAVMMTAPITAGSLWLVTLT